MTGNRTTELLPCPFCGGEAEMLHAVGEWWAICKFCKATTEAHTDKGFAIAAWNARADYHGFEQAAIEAWESVKSWNTRAELGSGTLTAEQVREAIACNSWQETSMLFEFSDSSWQAIADELNAALGSGTCKLLVDGDLLHCSNCGGAAEKQSWAYWSYCPNCGCKAVKR